MDETWGYFFKKRYEKKPNCSLCYNVFREHHCFEFFVYKCICKCCEREEIMCRFCAQHTQKFVHLCKCERYIERHLCDNLPIEYNLSLNC